MQVESKQASGPVGQHRVNGRGAFSGEKKLSNQSSRLLALLVRVLGVLAVVLVLRYCIPATLEEIQYRLTRGRQRAEYETSGAALQRLELHRLSAVSQLVSQRVGPTVVHIDAERGDSHLISTGQDRQSSGSDLRQESADDDQEPGRSQEQGSGVVVDAAGFVVTNYHVVASADAIDVTLSDGRRVPGAIVGFDWLTDVAVLKIDVPHLMAAQWGDSDRLREGALVWALGTPYGLKPSITSGIISAKSLAGVAGSVYQDYLQTDAAINPGSSGGPLVDVEGKVVGINTAIIGESYRGISFAVPSNIARGIYERIRKEGRVDRGWLGVELSDVSTDQARHLGLAEPAGALVIGVGYRDANGSSPATEAGVQIGDVIVRWDATPVDRKETLIRQVAQSPIGASIQMEIIRRGHRLTLPITVGKAEVARLMGQR
jgi:S1-C subfamily serine protease